MCQLFVYAIFGIISRGSDRDIAAKMLSDLFSFFEINYRRDACEQLFAFRLIVDAENVKILGQRAGNDWSSLLSVIRQRTISPHSNNKVNWMKKVIMTLILSDNFNCGYLHLRVGSSI